VENIDGVYDVVADCDDVQKEPEMEVSSDDTSPRTPIGAANRLSLRPHVLLTSAPRSVSELIEDD
jgi:hypothetical protein